MIFKICPHCGVQKDENEFGKNKNRRDGLQGYCKICRKQQYEENKEEILECNRKFYEENKEMISARNKDWRAKNPEKVKARKKHYRETNKEKIAVGNRCYRTENAEKIKTHYKSYYEQNTDMLKTKSSLYKKTHPEKIREQTRKRRAMKRSVNENFTAQDELLVFEVFGNRCANCGSIENLCIDHFYPLSAGNALTINNACLLCGHCNCSKRNSDPKCFFTADKYNEITQLMSKAIELNWRQNV